MRFLISSITVGCLAAGATFGTGDDGRYGRFQIAEEPSGARISSLGSAGTALASSPVGCYNPASPAFAGKPYVSAEFGQLPGEMSRSLIESAWMFRTWFAGASLRVHSTDFPITTEQSDGQTGPTGSNQTLQASIAGGFIVGRFASGHSVTLFHERIGDQVFRAWTYSPGFIYQLVPNSLVLGLSLLQYVRLDTSINLVAWRKGAIGLPRYARAGAAWSDTLRRVPLPFTVACDITYSDVYDRFMVPIGIEAWVVPSLAIRVGAEVNHPSEVFHAGAGLRWNALAFDVDYGQTKPPVSGAELESKWLLGLTYSLPQSKKPPAAGKKEAVLQNKPQPEQPASLPVEKSIVPTEVPVPEQTVVPQKPADSLIQPAVPVDSSAVNGSPLGVESKPPDSSVLPPVPAAPADSAR